MNSHLSKVNGISVGLGAVRETFLVISHCRSLSPDPASRGPFLAQFAEKPMLAVNCSHLDSIDQVKLVTADGSGAPTDVSSLLNTSTVYSMMGLSVLDDMAWPSRADIHRVCDAFLLF